MKSALIRVRELSDVFGHVSPSNFEAIMSRLAVLYEDLRIELYGIAEDTIPAMDKFDVIYGVTFLCHAHAYQSGSKVKNLNEHPDLSEWHERMMG